MAANKTVHIVGGGTLFYLREHFALCSPAYGGTARRLHKMFIDAIRHGTSSVDVATVHDLDVCLHLTKMAGGDPTFGYMETNQDIGKLIDALVEDPATKIVILTAAMLDHEGVVMALNEQGVRVLAPGTVGRFGTRLKSRDTTQFSIDLAPAEKVVKRIRAKRKDIFAVAFKETCGFSEDEQYIAGLNLLKESSVNLVLANDMETMVNMIITPEEARYHVTTDRNEALHGLMEMAVRRSQLTFTRSTVVAGDPIPWDSDLIPAALRTVVDYCIAQGAYKPFNGATVGHFACKLNENTFLTSIRKSNFNDLDKNGLVKIVTDGPDSVIAYGAKPSVGGQSQRIVFNDHREYDCIVHFHCPKKRTSLVPEVSQREYECGSHQCGQNTSSGLKKFGNLSAVYLQEHGPNIVFNRSIDPMEVIDFISANFDLDEKTGGYVSLGQILKTPDTLDSLKQLVES